MNNKGLGLVEVLVTASLMGVLFFGGAQTLKIALQASSVQRAMFAENDLRTTVAKNLSGSCWDNLRNDDTNRLSGPHKANGIGDITSLLYGKITTGQPFKDKIDIIKMELTSENNPPPPDDLNRDFIIYYKKRGLGSLNTIQEKECSTSSPPGSLIGCYHYKCTVRYETNTCTAFCSDLSEKITAEVQSTVVQKVDQHIASKQWCGDKKYFIGFDSDGNPKCGPEIDCPAGQTLRVYEENGVKKKQCLTVPETKNCPPGQFVREIRQDGTVHCESACSGVKELWESREYDNNVNSEITKIYNKVGGNISEPGWNYLNVLTYRFCRCPASAPHWDGSDCTSCSGGGAIFSGVGFWHEWSMGHWYSGVHSTCRCPAGKVKKKVV